MSDHEKKPAHELLLANLAYSACKVSEGGDIIPLAISSASTTLILSVMHHMVIPNKHREEIVVELRNISAKCTNRQLSGDISALADRLKQEG